MIKHKTSIIIATWNALPYFKKAVEAVKRYTPNDYELIIVDNGSRPDMTEYIKSLNCKYIFNDTNLGPGAAFNQGINISDGEYICLLNSDAEVTNDWLNSMLTTLNSDSTIGIVGPMCNNISSSQSELRRLNGYDFEIPIGYVMPFVCVLMKRHILKTIGLIAERFVQGCSEDSEYCNRLNNNGYKKMVSAKAYVNHYLNQSYRDNNVDTTKVCYDMGRLLDKTEELKYLVD